jgi:fatty acid desaturase
MRIEFDRLMREQERDERELNGLRAARERLGERLADARRNVLGTLTMVAMSLAGMVFLSLSGEFGVWGWVCVLGLAFNTFLLGREVGTIHTDPTE